MLLPRDMESLDDCLCHGNATPLANAKKPSSGGSVFRCPTGAAATRLHPSSFADCACVAGFTRDDMREQCVPDQFQCVGRYRLKDRVAKAASIADCDCQPPYKKDEASGACVLRQCPRAGNYVQKFQRKPVTSLADCACVEPFIKNDQSGECLVGTPFTCPPFSQPLATKRATSFADCHCDWGYVRSPTQASCERESVAYACPNHAVKRAGLDIHARAQSFADCECENDHEFRRNDETHTCERRNKDVDGDGRDEIDEDEVGKFQCPAFARPLSPLPHSVEQCECLSGYGWKTPEMTCVKLSAFACPPHSFKANESLQAERSFRDCECARGYFRDETHGACLEWFLANDNGCPDYAFLRHWPLQSKANCQCIYGLHTGDSPVDTPPPRQSDEGERQQTKSKKTPLVKKPPTQCNAPPSFLNVGFSQCPDNAVAIQWPLTSPDDCMCKDGFDVLPISEAQFLRGDGEGFLCVDPATTITEEEGGQDTMAANAVVCRAPLVKNPFTGDCRLPVEQVRPLQTTNAKQNGDRGVVVFKGIEYDYVLTEDDIMVIQGDVAIGELARWPITVDGTQEEVSFPVLHGYYNSERDHRWKNATLCYEIDASASSFQLSVENAMAHITDVTNFQFQQCLENACVTDAACVHDFVRVQKTASSCFSYIGRIGGRQALGVSAECGQGNLVHVLLHAIGLRHTIDRADRDDHVRVAWECVPEPRRSFFVVEETNDDAFVDTPYDFFSIMHHPSDAFVNAAATPWCESLFPLITDPMERVEVMGKMGQRELLAVTDIHAVWALYPTLQQNDKPPTYISQQQEDGDPPAVFESRLHTKDDVDASAASSTHSGARSSSWGRKLGSFVGALATLTGFALLVAFAVVELRRRAQQMQGGAYYSESLLTDKTSYD
jgi:hypothetical protein